MDQLVVNRNEVIQGPAPRCLAAIRRFKRGRACAYFGAYYESLLIPHLAKTFHHPERQIITSYGEEDFLRTVFDGLNPRSDSVLTHQLHYSYYDKYLALKGIRLHIFGMVEREDDFAFDVEDCLRQYDRWKPRLVVITSPNNPTGNTIAPGDLDRVVSGVSRDTLVLLDEAYFGFDPRYDPFATDELLRKHPNLVVLRTFSKLYALAGLRIAFALCGENVKEILRYGDRYLGMSRILEEVAIAALESPAYYEKVADRVIEDREWLIAEIRKLRCFRPYQSKGNFVCIRADERVTGAAQAALERARVLRAKFVTGNLMRVSVGVRRYTQQFVRQMEAVDEAARDGAATVWRGATLLEAPREEGSVERLLLDRNENQYGPSPACYEVLRCANLEQLSFYSRDYLRGRKSELSCRLSQEMGIPEEQVVLSYGSEDMLKQVVHCYLNAGQTMLLPSQSWWYYKSVAAEVQGRPVEYPIRETQNSFEYDRQEIMRLYDQYFPQLILIASPNNPTGNSISHEAIGELVDYCKSSVIVLDEAYFGFSGESNGHVKSLLDRHRRLVVLRTFSKYYALAGLRIGYACLGEDLSRLVRFSARYLGYNQLSERIALAALEDKPYYRSIARRMIEDKRRYYEELSMLEGFAAFRSDANFVLVRYPGAHRKRLEEGLTERNVIVKFLDDPGLEDCIRITIGTQEQNAWVISALKEVAAGYVLAG